MGITVFDARDVISQFPEGDNATDTVLGGVHLNLSALEFWNYTLYSNGTLSNGSRCILTFEPYEPQYLFPNGSFTNSTSCYRPIRPLGDRGRIAIGLAAYLAVFLMLTLACLRKHGRMFLPTEKRFRPVGRRWQWYWMIVTCATGFISLITAIDVDRYYMPEIPIVLVAFFWFLMNLASMAAVWEAVRHWGSWMERQYIDPDPFALKQGDARATFEFWMPLVFYLFWWLEFFLVVPRNWGNIELQRSAEQSAIRAEPSATDSRFKAAAFMLFACWLLTAIHLRHSIKYYRERNRGLMNRAIGLIRYTPYRFILLLPLSLAVVAYQALSAWEFRWSVLDVTGNKVAIYVGGYIPALLIILVQIAAGFTNPNEDKELIRQRRVRGVEQDRELGIVRKPTWWRRINGDIVDGETMRDRIARNVREVGGGRPTARNIGRQMETRVREAGEVEVAADIEMGQMRRTESHASRTVSIQTRTAGGAEAAARPSANVTYSGKSGRRRSERTVATAASLLFPNVEPSPTTQDRRSYLMGDGLPPPYQGQGLSPDQQQHGGRPQARNNTTAGCNGSDGESSTLRPGTAGRSTSTGTTNSVGRPPQQVRSMLDV